MKSLEEKPRIRITRQRKVILEGLKNTTSHPTAGEIYDIVRRELPRVSLGTVYRNLEVLCRDGHIRKLDLDEGQKRFDGKTDPHYHLRCLNCGRVVDINLPPQTEIEKKANTMNNCVVTGHKLEFSGLCSRCRQEKGGSKNG
jgi:Fur family transcriptional regulator, peroxide stress response regulator